MKPIGIRFIDQVTAKGVVSLRFQLPLDKESFIEMAIKFAVFISSNNKHMYFSSMGHYGMGDMDIYRSEWDEENASWKEPINMGYPINSVENDIYFVLSATEEHAYFSSVKFESKGEQDIYKVFLGNYEPLDLRNYTIKETIEKRWIPRITMDLSIQEAGNKKPASAQINFTGPDGKTIEGELLENGMYRYEFPVSDDTSNYKIMVEYASVEEREINVVGVLALDKLKQGEFAKLTKSIQQNYFQQAEQFTDKCLESCKERG